MNALLDVCGAQESGLAQREGDVVEDGDRVEQAGLLEDEREFLANSSALECAEANDVNTTDADLTKIGAFETNEQSSERALSGSGCADDNARFSARDSQAKAVQYELVIVALYQVAHVDE